MFDIVEALKNAAALAGAVRPLLTALGVTVGLVLIARAGYLMVWGRNGGGVRDDIPFGSVVTNTLIGSCLLSFSRSIANTSDLLGGAGSGVREAVAYMTPNAGGGDVYSLALNAAFLWVGAIGACGVFRGLLLWQEMGSGNNNGGGGDLFWRGLWHILGGGVAINMGM